MKILILGGGGREHAIATAFSRSERVDSIWVSPGNPGMRDVAETIALPGFGGIVEFCREKAIDLVFVGPEQPLAAGVADFLIDHGISVVGPVREAAAIEGSKLFAKQVMESAGVPTSGYRAFSCYDSVLRYLESARYPVVVKADGLAAGKGVAVCKTRDMAFEHARRCMQDDSFGEAGHRLVIEEFLQGWEASAFAFCDGENFVSTVISQDHKQLMDGDRGPNTGGMGAYAPVKEAGKYRQQIDEEIFHPVLEEMKRRGAPYRGILYAGLMITSSGPKVIEFNCRLGDPETQAVLPLLKTDLVEISEAIINGKIGKMSLEWDSGTAVTVVAASEGYPGSYEKRIPIRISEPLPQGCHLYWAGVAEQSGQMVTAGGRVCMVTGLAGDLDEAIALAYRGMDHVQFAGKTIRTDIGKRSLTEK